MNKLFIILIIFSGSVFADSYPAASSYTTSGFVDGTFSTADAACSAIVARAVVVTGASCCGVVSGTGISARCSYNDMQTSRDLSLGFIQTCPDGGTLSGSSCVNAPPCALPSIRQSGSPYGCVNPVQCDYPETDNGSGVCSNNACPSGQTRNPTTKQCQVPPVCAATESYDIYGNSCHLSKLACPGHAHANTANDACLPDAPLTCPIGQHDDGSYACIADDAPRACNPDKEVKGYIDGFPNCIKKTNASQFSIDAAGAAAVAKTAADAAAVAKTAADAAASASAADPNDVAKLATSLSTLATSTAAALLASTTKDTADKAQKDADSAALRSIADNSQIANDLNLAKTGSSSTGCSSPPTCSGDPVQCALLFQSFHNHCDGLPVIGSSDIPVPEEVATQIFDAPAGPGSGQGAIVPIMGSCPAPQSIATHFGNMSLSFQPLCDFSTMNSGMVIAMAWLISGYIVFGSKVA